MTATVYELVPRTQGATPDPAVRARELASICDTFLERTDMAWLRDLATGDSLFAEMLEAYESRSPLESRLTTAGVAAIAEASRP